jgi:protein-L-isoaspartate(D-aspartate) O-methyltransferase
VAEQHHAPPGAVTSAAAPSIESYLEAYVERLKASGCIRDPAVERAFRRVRRDLFVERFYVGQAGQGEDKQVYRTVDYDPQHPTEEPLRLIYADEALITRLSDNVGTSSSSQPSLVAQMLHLLELRPGMRLLEIGAGTGYNAALLAESVGDASLVTTLDIQADVVEQTRRNLARAGYGAVRVLHRDGFYGAPEGAPFERIVATVGCPEISPRWVEQLAPSGFMLIPLRHAGANPLVRIWREGSAGDTVVGRVVSFSGFMAIQGALRVEGYYHGPPSPPDAAEEERPLWPGLAAPGAADPAPPQPPPGPSPVGPVAPASGQVRDGPAGERVSGPLIDFWFFLGLRDARTRMFRWLNSFGVADPATRRSARIEGGRLVGEPALLSELDAHYQEWLRLGAPSMTRFRLHLVPAGADPVASVGGPAANWTLPGSYYHKVFTLPQG